MALSRPKLEKWLRRQLNTTQEENPICRLTLRHAMGGSKAATVWDNEVGPHSSYMELASQIEEAATDDAEGLGGLQSYVLSVYFTSVPDKVRERLSFKLNVPSETDDEVESSEAANAQGLLSQLMRHNEANARVMTMGMAEVVRQQNRMIERLGDQNDRLMERHYDVLEMTETLLTARSEKEIEKMQLTSKISRDEQLVEKFLQLAPAVVNRLGGKKMLPESTTPGEMMVMNFVKSLKPEQMGKILETLEPEQQLLVMELVQQQQAVDAAAKEKK